MLKTRSKRRDVEPYWKRCLKLVGTVSRGGPLICTLQVTNRCNMRCSFCGFWSDGAPPAEELTLSQIRRTSEKLAEMGSLIISVEGGEPLLRPDIVEVVEALAAHHHPVLYTNGWHVDANMARALFDAGLIAVGVSLDYANPERHDAHRLQGSYDRVMAAVQHFQDAAPRGRHRVHLITVLMEDNRDELEPLLELSKRLDVRHMVTLLAVAGYNRDSGKTLPVANKPLSPWLLGLKKRYPHFIDLTDYLASVDDYLTGKYERPCQAGRRGFNINHLGQVNPCIELTNVRLGHVLEHTNAELLHRLRSVEEVPTCQQCFTICRGNVQALGQGKLRSLVELLS